MRRITIATAKKMITDNEWHALDAACGHHAGWPEAAVLSDWGKFAKNYPGRRFVRSDIRTLPFDFHEFDFVIASHILEHLPEVGRVIGEISRVAPRGFIEVPTPLGDNLIVGNATQHEWFVTFDDEKEELVFRPRTQVIRPKFGIPGWTRIRKHFPESCVTQLYWEGQIKYRVEQ
jgi:hypothetical protein